MRKRSAFTLIELLVVIAVIVLLMAVLLPALQRAKKHARTVGCQMNLKQCSTAFSLDAADHEGAFVARSIIYDWPKLMQPYQGDSSDPRCCPMATKVTDPGPQAKLGSTYSAWGKLDFYGSYGLNGWFPRPTKEVIDAVKGVGGKDYSDTDFTRFPANGPVLLDCIGSWSAPDANDMPPQQEDVAASFMAYFCINRHGGFVNGLFRDWSVRKVGLKELWTLKWHREYDTAGPWTRAGEVEPEDWPQWMRSFKEY
ncbi:MAG: type II secretion system protein [Phycisphaerales bacterium]|nr:MAG: type II secretion system protein [Phycisphaerales bacterium]